MVADGEVRHARSDRRDDPGPLVAEDRRQRRIIIAVPSVQVGLAHPARDDPYQQLVRPRIRQVQLFDAEASALSRATAATICMNRPQGNRTRVISARPSINELTWRTDIPSP